MTGLDLRLAPASSVQIEAACLTRSATDAMRWLATHGLEATLTQCNVMIAAMVAEGRRGKLSTACAGPTAEEDAIRHNAATGCQMLLRRHLETGAHWISDPARMAAARREAGL